VTLEGTNARLRIAVAVLSVMLAGLLGYTGIYIPNRDAAATDRLNGAVTCMLAHLADHRVNTAQAHLADAAEHNYEYPRRGFEVAELQQLADESRAACMEFQQTTEHQEGSQ
jgi:hypothetical protein